MQPRRFLAAAALLFTAGLTVEAPPTQMPRFSYSRHLPHQGKRECARRRGGKDWADWLAADRVARGLPA